MLGCGEGQKEALRPDFNRSILVDFQGAKISSDTGFLLLSEMGERFGVSALFADADACSRRFTDLGAKCAAGQFQGIIARWRSARHGQRAGRRSPRRRQPADLRHRAAGGADSMDARAGRRHGVQ